MAVYKLKDICLKIGSGATPRGGKEAYCDEGISLIRSQNVLDFTFSHDGLAHINEKQAEKLSNVEVKSQDILLNITGDSVARACAVDVRVLPARVNQHVAIIRPNEDEVLSSYILFYLQMMKPYLLQIAAGGATRNALTKGMIENLELEVPDILFQKKIVSILDDIQEKIRENKERNKNLEQQAMALFKSWFIDYEPFGGQLPTIWKSGVLGDFVEIKRGGSPRPIQNFLSDSGLHWLKISDATCISSPFINEIKEYIIEDGLKKTVFLKAGNLVLSNSATPGLPKILDIDTCIHDGWLYFPSSKFSNEYLYLYFRHIRDNLVALGNGSVFTNLKTDILKNYPTNLPTGDVLSKFDEVIKPMFSMILSKTRESKRLMEIRDSLLPKLMSGELDVSDIDL